MHSLYLTFVDFKLSELPYCITKNINTVANWTVLVIYSNSIFISFLLTKNSLRSIVL